MSAAMLTDVCFNFCSFLKHGRKFRVFRLIKAIVADAENAIAVRQQRNDPSKIALPVAAGAGKQQDIAKLDTLIQRIYEDNVEARFPMTASQSYPVIMRRNRPSFRAG